MRLTTQAYTQPDDLGFYGEFGGVFIPELLRPNVEALDIAFRKYCNDDAPQKN